MNRLFWTIGLFSLLLIPRPVWADCRSNADCRGNRVCRAGRCVDAAKQKCKKDIDCPEDQICDGGVCISHEPEKPKKPKYRPITDPFATLPPPSLPAPAPPPVHVPGPAGMPHRHPDMEIPKPEDKTEKPAQPKPSVSTFKTFYGAIGPSILMTGRGKTNIVDYDDELISLNNRDKAGAGIHLNLAFVTCPYFHIGAFFTYNKLKIAFTTDDYDVPSKKFQLVGLGLSLKAGAPASSRVWIGGVVDAGYARPFWKDDDEMGGWHGIHLGARLNLDIIAFQAGDMKMGFNIGFGIETVAYAKGKTDFSRYDDLDSEFQTVRLQLLLALIMGS